MFSDKQRYNNIKDKFNNAFRSKLSSSNSFKNETDESIEEDAGSTLLQRNINLIPDQLINIEETEDFKTRKHTYNYSPENIKNEIPKIENKDTESNYVHLSHNIDIIIYSNYHLLNSMLYKNY